MHFNGMNSTRKASSSVSQSLDYFTLLDWVGIRYYVRVLGV